MKLFTTKATLVAAIEDIRVTGKKLDSMIWVAAVSVIAHIEKHGDITLAQTLVDAMPKGSRVNALLAYLEEFGKLSWDAAEKKLAYAKTKTSNVEGAMAISWVEFKPEPPYQAMTLESAVAALIKKAQDRADLGDERDHIDMDRLAAMSKMVSDWALCDEMNAASAVDPIAADVVTLAA